MKLKLIIIFLLTHIISFASSQNGLDSLLIKLDEAIKNTNDYSEKREIRIHGLKTESVKTNPFSVEKYNLNMQIFREYKSYVCDSAIAYLNSNIEIANRLNDEERKDESKILLAHLLGSTGMYKESVDVLSSIDRKKMPHRLYADYYAANDHVYGELAYYTQDKVSAQYYYHVAENYKDSLRAILPPDDERMLIMQETAYRDAKEFDKARELNDIRLQKVQPGTPEYALVTFYRALLARQEGNKEEEKYYLVLSALSDIQTGTKDHASLWMLAKLLYESDEDIERAYNYIRFSWNETVFYNARLRSLQSADIMSLIDKTYQAMIEKQNKQLQLYLILISALLLLLAAALAYIYRQMKKLSAIRYNLQNVNIQLKNLNEELQVMNLSLQSTNIDLSESNLIKEKYIGRFINLCSTYINKLDAYRRMVYKKAADKQIDELIKITRSPEALDVELKELYTNFDTAFLQLFPDFVNRFNDLLQEDEHILLKKGELLNTELRIFALIRLGIDDSSQIAEFLRYSVNTIYNYRAKIKNKARVVRDDFENLVKEIR